MNIKQLVNFNKVNGTTKLLVVPFGLILILSSIIVTAQETIRFKDEVFQNIDSVSNIVYGNSVNLKGQNKDLLLDFFTPHNDTMVKRPLMIFIHGGGFQNNTKTGSYSSLICSGLAKRGYVTATIDYRLGLGRSKSDTDYFKALYRAVQDAKAAVRFFRRYADKYGIDTSQIFIMGSSAGAKTAMHLAYLKQNDVPEYISKDLGSIEGNSGNEGFSSKVNLVVNCWGAMIDYKWLNKGSVPLFNVCGLSDKLVPSDSSFDYHGFKYGSKILYYRALSEGIPTGFRPFENTGHTLDNNKLKQDSAYNDIGQWLYTRLKYHTPNKTEVFKWEKEIQNIEKSGKIFTEKGDNNILFIGSSYIRLWGENMQEDLAPIKTINLGFGGSKLSDVAYYIDRLVEGQKNLSGIFLYVGNDIVGAETDKTPLQDLELVKYITNKLRQHFPSIPIYWAEISPSEKRWKVWDKIQEANRLIKEYCTTESNFIFVESSKYFLNDKGLPITNYFRDDHLHYNNDGYKIWGEVIKEKILRH